MQVTMKSSANTLSTRHSTTTLALWILLGVACLPIDLPLARVLMDGVLPGELRAVFARVEAFGHAYGVACIAITIYLLDERNRQELGRVVGTFVAAGVSANILKLQFWRIRPRAFVEGGLGESTFVGTIWTGWPHDWSVVFDSRYHSFPSAHTAGAVALAYRLGELYPQGRRWFYVLAGLCGMNRVDGGAHFLSDVCWGVALGYAVAVAIPESAPLRAMFGRRRIPVTHRPSLQSGNLVTSQGRTTS